MISFHMVALGVGVFLLTTVSSAASSDCRNVWQNCWNLITEDITNCEKRDYQRNCKRTCGLCGDCRDKHGIRNCRNYINANIQNCDKQIFQRNCNRTCGLCGGCQDTWVKSCWKEITTDINRCNQAYYQTICKKTCGVCGGCSDLRSDCHQYSRRCSEPWMQVSCRKTCRTCVDEVEQRVEVKTAASVIWTTAQDVLDKGSFRFWIVYVIILLLLGFIGVLVVFIIIRRRGARRETADGQNKLSAAATERFNVEAPVYSDTPGGVAMASSAANEMPGTCALYNSNAAMKSSDKKGDVNHGKNTSTDNEKWKSSEENQQTDLCTVGNSNYLHDYAGEITPEQLHKPSQAGSASREMEEDVGTADSRNANSIHDNERNSLYTKTEEAGSSRTQNMTVKEEGLLYTELDFTQYRPDTQRTLPQKEETNYSAIEFKAAVKA